LAACCQLSVPQCLSSEDRWLSAPVYCVDTEVEFVGCQLLVPQCLSSEDRWLSGPVCCVDTEVEFVGCQLTVPQCLSSEDRWLSGPVCCVDTEVEFVGCLSSADSSPCLSRHQPAVNQLSTLAAATPTAANSLPMNGSPYAALFCRNRNPVIRRVELAAWDSQTWS